MQKRQKKPIKTTLNKSLRKIVPENSRNGYRVEPVFNEAQLCHLSTKRNGRAQGSAERKTFTPKEEEKAKVSSLLAEGVPAEVLCLSL